MIRQLANNQFKKPTPPSSIEIHAKMTRMKFGRTKAKANYRDLKLIDGDVIKQTFPDLVSS